jgi:hypothetical protein
MGDYIMSPFFPGNDTKRADKKLATLCAERTRLWENSKSELRRISFPLAIVKDDVDEAGRMGL